jgi:hypothetical protein
VDVLVKDVRSNGECHKSANNLMVPFTSQLKQLLNLKVNGLATQASQ